MMENESNDKNDFYGWKSKEQNEEPSFIFRATKTVRVISGGTMNDFDDLEKAYKFMFEKLKVYPYASINVKCPVITKEEIWPPTTS